jgi:hypothetical protein
MSRSISKKFTNVFLRNLIRNSRVSELSQDFYLKDIHYHRRLPLWDTESNTPPNMDRYPIFHGKEQLNLGDELGLGPQGSVSPCCWDLRASKLV